MKFLFKSISIYPKILAKISSAKTISVIEKYVKQLKKLQGNIPREDKFGWYIRHQIKGKIPLVVLKEQLKKVDKD